MHDLIIIGAGVTGFGAGMYARRMGLSCLVIGTVAGGTIITTDVVENYPGFELLTGQELADKIMNHALKFGVEFAEETVRSIEKKKELHFVVKTKEKTYDAKAVLIATGTKDRKLEVPGEEQFFAKGVHTCALCDAYFYKGKHVAVIGGSDSAAKEALLLSEHAAHVTMIYRGEKIRPEPINYDRVLARKNISIIYKTNVLEIKGDKRVTSIMLDQPHNGSKEFKVDGIFLAIGHIPQSQLAIPLGITLNKKSEIIIDRQSQTNVKGVFAAGDVADTVFKQAITGVAEGVAAVYSTYQYLGN